MLNKLVDWLLTHQEVRDYLVSLGWKPPVAAPAPGITNPPPGGPH